MIVENIMDLIFNFVFSLFQSMPVMNLAFDISKYDVFLEDIEFAVWFLPWRAIVVILSINLVLLTWRVLISLAKVIVEFIPFF